MERPVVDIIIPVYRPNDTFRLLLRKLQEQTFVVHKVIIANTEQSLWEDYLKKEYGSSEAAKAFFRKLPFALEVFHVKKEDFDHGGTRRLAVQRSEADIFICMTQDAFPADEFLVEQLIKPLEDAGVAAVCGRQIPREDCSIIEAYVRSFNYPDTDRIVSKEDIERLGIKTFFCSNVCAAYRRNIWDSLGGFEMHTIFNEDMIFAGHAVYAGYSIAYAAEAAVIHSHNYSGREQFQRNFDLAVSQKQHPEVFAGVRSESEGVRMVINTAKHLLTGGKPWLIINLVWQSAWKYMGYRAGKKYETMKRNRILRKTMNPGYWHALWKRDRVAQQDNA